nr:hypothetical protein [Candidatus Sigynarchaeota archaeon]
MAKKIRQKPLRDFITGEPVTSDEMDSVDREMARFEMELLEEFNDALPRSANPRKAPFVHVNRELGYETVNIGRKTFASTLKVIQSRGNEKC